MEIEYAFLARAADVSPDGTLSMLGTGFEIVRSRIFPRDFTFSIVVRLRDIVTSTQNMTLEFDAFDETDKSILDAPYVVSTVISRRLPLESVVSEGSGNIVFGILGLVIPIIGIYRLVLKLTGENVVGREFRLVAEELHD